MVLSRTVRNSTGLNRTGLASTSLNSTSFEPHKIEAYGLEWKDTIFGLEPIWTVEPDIDTIRSLAQQHLYLSDDARWHFTFYAQGGFNKLFRIDTDKSSYLMRVALPVDPYAKTASEVATIEFVRQKTTIPVPSIIDYDASTQNTLRFEWILMEFVAGRPLRQTWRKMSMNKKEALARQLAMYQAQLFDHKFDWIGNLFKTREGESFDLERVVAMPFFFGDRATFNVPRGPYRNSYDWLSARISLLLQEQESILQHTDDEDEIEDATTSRSLAQQLQVILPDVCQSDAVESTFLFHDDLSMSNILVDESDTIVAIVDWECVSALPIWRACQLPHLLAGRVRIKKPQKETYGPEESPEESFTDDSDVDNEGVSQLYWEHLQEYEIGQLREIFLLEMERLQPEWMQEYRQGQLKCSFETAVSSADNEWRLRSVQEWLDAYKAGEAYGLKEKLVE